MVEAVIMLLIYIAIIALVIWLALWVLEQVGFGLPAQVVKILWVIAVLVIILVGYHTLAPVLHLPR